MASIRSDLPMFLEEAFEALHLHAVVDIGVPFEGRAVECGVSPALGSERVLLVLHVVVSQARQLSTLPAKVALVPSHVKRAKEEHAVDDH